MGDAAAATAPELVVTNFHRRFTGVSATADAVVSCQRAHYRMDLVGHALPSVPEPISYRRALAACRRRPDGKPFAIWHVRRNAEMAAAIFARDVLRLPIRTLFTSAAQRRHSAFPRGLIGRMDAVVATTAKAASFIPGVAAVIPHGVDIRRFRPLNEDEAKDAPLCLAGRRGIGIVGRIRPEKGTDLFVEALLGVLPRRPDYAAVVIGRAMPADAAFEQRLRTEIARAGLADRFLFLGERPPAEIPRLMRSLSLLVAPARYEGYGMTVLEAMASGTAVVASDTGVYGEVIEPGREGFVTPVGDAEALSRAILQATADFGHLRFMGRAARDKAAKKLSLEQETAAYGDLMKMLWQGGKVARPNASNPNINDDNKYPRLKKAVQNSILTLPRSTPYTPCTTKATDPLY